MYKVKAGTGFAFLSPSHFDEAGIAIDRAKRLLADSSAGLLFDAESHTYILGDREMTSVSNVVKFFAPFDSLPEAIRCSKNPKHELYGKDPEEIVKIWSQRGEDAAKAGTQVHEFGEACFVLKTDPSLPIASEYEDRMTEEGLEASNAKEEAVARWWDNLDFSRYVPIVKEARIVNPELGYAGTMDLLLYDLLDKCYVLKDYKTNASLFRSFGKKMKAPLSVIAADNIGKYTLQQNLYKIQLENIGINVGRMDLIWLKDDGSFQEVALPNYDRLIRFAMQDEHIKKLLNKKACEYSQKKTEKEST